MLSAEINLPRIFSDDMLIQRQKPVKIWGTADANAAVEVEFAGAKSRRKPAMTASGASYWIRSKHRRRAGI